MRKTTPILYKAGEKDFATLGICKLTNATKCSVDEERNSDFTATVEVPAGSDGYEDLTTGNIVLCRPAKFETEMEAFEIVSTEASTETETKTAVCRQVALQRMRHMIVGPVSKMDAKATAVLQAVWNAVINKPGSSELQISLYTDVTIKNEFEVEVPKSLYDVFFEDETGIIAKFGGEMQYHLGKISLLAERGEDRGETVKYARNMENMELTEDQSEVVTGICAYYAKKITGTDEVMMVMGTQKIITIEGAETAYPHIIPVDATNSILPPAGASNEWTPTSDVVEEWARKYLSYNYDGMVPVTVSASVVEDPEYAEEREMRLADTVRLLNPTMGVNMTAKIIKTTYNALNNSWEEIGIGSVRSNLAQTIVDMMKSKTKITQVTIGGGNTGSDGNWKWTVASDGNSVTAEYNVQLNSSAVQQYGYYYYIEHTAAMPTYFSEWTMDIYTLKYSFTATDEDNSTDYLYLKSYDTTSKTVTMWVYGASSSINGILHISVDLTKSS